MIGGFGQRFDPYLGMAPAQGSPCSGGRLPALRGSLRITDPTDPTDMAVEVLVIRVMKVVRVLPLALFVFFLFRTPP